MTDTPNTTQGKGAVSYPIDTLTQMAAIPAEAWPRFAAELPLILAEINRIQGVMLVFNEAFEGVFDMNATDGATWTDDDKVEVNMTVSMDGADDTICVTRKMGDVA